MKHSKTLIVDQAHIQNSIYMLGSYQGGIQRGRQGEPWAPHLVKKGSSYFVWRTLFIDEVIINK